MSILNIRIIVNINFVFIPYYRTVALGVRPSLKVTAWV